MTDDIPAVVPDFIGDTLVLRLTAEIANPAQLSGLPAEEDRLTVVCTAGAVLRPTLPDVLMDVLSGSAVGLRLIMLGPLPDGVSIVAAVDFLAAMLRKPVTAPLTPYVPGRLPGPGWITCAPGLPHLYEAPWPPVPAEPDPEPVADPAAGASRAQVGWPGQGTGSVQAAEPCLLPAVTVTLLAGRSWPEAGPSVLRPDPVTPASPDNSPVADAQPVTSTAPQAAVATLLAAPSAMVRGAPLWISAADWCPDDRAGLRTALNGSYDAHVRVVTKTLSEQPGLRAGAVPDLVPALAAVRGYLTEHRDEVNRTLRAGNADHPAAVIARGAAYGLRFLPTVFGPVYRGAQISSGTLAGYQPGRILAEPAFLDVSLSPARRPDATVQFVIWSVSARRLGPFQAGSPTGLFPPATRFSVLTVDHPGPETEIPRVLLCDLAGVDRGGPAGGNTDRLLTRMRETTVSTAAVPAPDNNAAPGLDDTGSPYPWKEDR